MSFPIGLVAAFLIYVGAAPAAPWMQVEATKPAARVATRQVAPNPYPKPATPDWARCPQWWDLARDVGWPESQMPTVDYVMHRESNCDPHAYNRSGATGLMQLLGWHCDPSCFDPRGNLAKALDLWRSSGWRPWCLRGDPVTGSC